MKTEKLQLFVLALIAAFIIAALCSCSSNRFTTDKEYHMALQKEITFEKAMGRNESFTKASYQDDLKTLRLKVKELKYSDKDSKKKEKLLKEIEALRAKIESK